jgi:hypothetical protein
MSIGDTGAGLLDEGNKTKWVQTPVGPENIQHQKKRTRSLAVSGRSSSIGITFWMMVAR